MAPLAEPLVSVVPPWHFLPGHLHGLPQPGLTGLLQIRSFHPGLLHQIDRDLGSVVGELPPALRDDRSAMGLARRVAHVLAACQRAARIVVADVSHVEAPVAGPQGAVRCRVLVCCPHRQAAKQALPLVLDLVNRSSRDTPSGRSVADLADTLRTVLRRFAEPGQNRSHLLRAALAMDLPCTFVAPQTYRIGVGCRQQVLHSTATQHTPYIGVILARNKLATGALLRRHGLPAAEHLPADDADQAVAAARSLGFPVVVKPGDRDGGQGVWADVRDEHTVRQAYEIARGHSSSVLVERHVAGTGHRLTVVQGQVVKVTAKQAWGVTGDGQRSVEQLVQDQLAAMPPKWAPHEVPSIDIEALGLLAQQGLAPTAVPSNGRVVPLRRRNNANSGGTTQRLDLDLVHPDNIDLALRTAQALMLDLAGVDLIVEDLGRSWMAQPAVICDVNAIPQTDLGTVTAVLARLMAGGARVPVTLLLVPDAAPAPTESQVLQLMQATGVDGLSGPWGVWLAGRRTAPALAGSFQAAQALLSSRELTRAAIVMGIDELARKGLPVDRFDRVCAGRDIRHLQEALATASIADTAQALYADLAHAATHWPRRDRDRLLALAGALAPHAAPFKRQPPADPMRQVSAT